MCQRAKCLLFRISFQFHCALRLLSAVAESTELHRAHVRWPTWLFSTDFHMSFQSTLSSWCQRTTRVWYFTTWSVTHSKTFCVRMVAFVCPLFQREAPPPFLSQASPWSRKVIGSRQRLQTVRSNSQARVSSKRFKHAYFIISFAKADFPLVVTPSTTRQHSKIWLRKVPSD